MAHLSRETIEFNWWYNKVEIGLKLTDSSTEDVFADSEYAVLNKIIALRTYHTTMIDLNGLDIDFPGHKSAKKLPLYEKVLEMERLIQEKLVFNRFSSYIQLHEFESLMFSDMVELEKWLASEYFRNIYI